MRPADLLSSSSSEFIQPGIFIHEGIPAWDVEQGKNGQPEADA